MKPGTFAARAGVRPCCGHGALSPFGRVLFNWILVALFAVAASQSRAQLSGEWQDQDIGSVAAAGSSSVSGDTVTVAGSGADIWGGNDAFHFRWQALTGDGSITARVTGLTNTHPWAKAGVMMRRSLAANASNIFLAATPDWHGVVAQQRLSASAETSQTQGPSFYPPYWLRLTRIGYSITAETSPDGATWTTLDSLSTAMSSTIYLGLAVTSHNDGALCTATFDNVSVVAIDSDSDGVPSAPTNLQANAVSSSQISLSWTNNDPFLAGYSVERSTTVSDFVEVFRSTTNASAHTDSGLSPAVTYYYRVRGMNSAGYGPPSNIASATTPAAPPSGAWQSADIGTTTAGSTSASGDAVTLTGSGRDIWNTADGLRYYYQPVGTGDAEIIVRVAALQNTNGWAKAGIMLRASLDPGSPQMMVCVSAEHGTAFQIRTTADGESQTSTPSEDGGPPRWLKLVYRAPDNIEPIPPTVTGYVSNDGVTWTAIGTYRDRALPWRYIGLAVTSHNDGALCTAEFDHLQLLTPPPAPTDLRVTQRGPDSRINLAWNYSTPDVTQFVIRTNRQATGDHEWRLAATVPATARTATIQIPATDGAEVEIKAMRDFVRSPVTKIWARPTITPSLAVTATTENSVSLRITEQYGYGGGEYGPWTIERSSDGANFTEIVNGLTPTGGTAYSASAEYTDSPLPAGATYYYRARELRPNGDSSSYSNIASAVTASPPPSGTWQSGEIGSVAMAGSESASGNTITVTGGGADIRGSADLFRFRYQILSGDGSITARVVSVSQANVWSKAGVMIRNSLAPGAPNIFAAVTPTWNGIVAQIRGTEGGQTTATSLAANGRPPYWVRVTRSGSIATAQSSPDGMTWNTGSSWYLGLGANVFIGLAVTSHDQNALCTATFDNVTISGGATPPPPPPPPPDGTWASTDIGAVGIAGSTTASGNTITIDGSGADIWGGADSFRFVSQARTGDGVVEAQITTMDDTNGWAKAGVMIRESLQPGARNVFLAVTPDFHGIVAQWRGNSNGETGQLAGPYRNAPIWLRIERIGSIFNASWSTDGVTWNGIASISLELPSTAQWGFAVTAHDNTQLNHVIFADPYIGPP
ncbi:MAG: hypothetical protein C0518_11095 [Opitutus sp.]|nr:hypothetical protein [Opitutus sp.]